LKTDVIAIVGGGVFVAKLCQVLAAHPAFAPCEIRLMARRYDRLLVIAAQCQRIVDRIAPGWKVRAVPTIADGCAGAAAIVLLLRQGGLRARALDESFPRAFGLTGDEGLGPGGIANALRTIPALRAIAEAIARTAPDAWILNMVAPLGVTTRCLLDLGLRTIGVCELPAVTERRLTAASRLPAAALHYAGFNHWGWFWADGDSSAELARASVETGLADRDTVREFGAVPLRYYYELFFPGKAERLGFRRSPTRAGDLIEISERIFESFPVQIDDVLSMFRERPTPWFDEALIPVLAALAPCGAYTGFANVRNDCRLPMVPRDAVIELRVGLSGKVLEKCETGILPPRVAAFLADVGRSEEFIYRAATNRDLSLQKRAIASALEALPLPPIRGSLQDLVNEIISAGSSNWD
jgi:6-phospho-beta-glucosidase